MNGSQFSVADGDGSGALVTAAGELDLAAVTFIDSSAIGVLVGAHKRLSTDGGTLLLRNPQDMPRRALEIVGLGEWIED